MTTARPRVLVTGFSVFPGAPVNPTEWLIGELAQVAPSGASRRYEVLDVAYQPLAARLEAIGAEFQPDIAIHFGLSALAEGFRIERLALNVVAPDRPDVSGYWPAEGIVREGGEAIGTTLPALSIHAALSAKNLPVAWSDDAGGYLCNYLFYLSCGGHCSGYAPRMAGFVHVPPLDAGPLTRLQLLEGALTIIDVCVDNWTENHAL